MCIVGKIGGNSSMNHHWGYSGREKEQKRKKRKECRNNSSYKECSSIQNWTRHWNNGCGFLRQMVSIDQSISQFDSRSTVIGFVKCHLKTQYKHEKYIKKFIQISYTMLFFFLTYLVKLITFNIRDCSLCYSFMDCNSNKKRNPTWDSWP